MKKIIFIILLVVILLIAMAWFGGRWMLSFSVAKYEGEVSVKGIENVVDITFDGKGIPQIWAETDNDMYFALGWLHASERLFQMELIRRLTRGELSEIFGLVAFQTDKMQRTIGFLRKAKADMASLNPETVALLQNYCNGINAWMGHKSILPPEFAILRFTPREWKPLDCVAIALYQTWYSHKLMDKDHQYEKLLQAFGDRVMPILKEYKDWSPPTVHDNFIPAIFGMEPSPFRMSIASNSWVVSPEKSLSGAALHASDPHLVVNQIPCFWYITGMHSTEGTNALGITVAGLPMLVMGHTDKIAYGFTVASVDIMDYYRYKRDAEDSLKILTANGWEEMETISENIPIKGKKQPVRVPVYIAPAGVVVESDSISVTSLHWAGFDFNAGEFLNAAARLVRIDNFQDFRETVTRFGALDVNWTYSDINGNIGYQLGTPVPVRNYSNTFVRLPGEDPDYQWQGYYPLKETPYLYNPKENWLATCNNQVVSDNWPYDLPGFYDEYRILRISKFLGEDKKFSVADFEKFQLDQHSVLADLWKSLFASGAQANGDATLSRQIEAWDGLMSLDGKIPALFALWWEYLPRVVFEDELGENWHLGKSILSDVIMRNAMNLIDDKKTAKTVEEVAQISARALDSALVQLGDRSYREFSLLTIEHPLSRVDVLNTWLNLNRGPFPRGGDFTSLNANLNRFDWKKGVFRTLVGPSMRFVLDWSDIDGFTINTNLGQSGNPFSPHYDDFLELWRKGERWNVPFTRGKVYAQKSSLLKLVPGE